MKYSIIIPTFNHCTDLLQPCIESIMKYTDLKDKEVIIVANGCTDETVGYIASLPQPFNSVIINKPLGYAKAINRGLEIASGDYIILLNNDTELKEQPIDQWVNILSEPFSDLLGQVTGISGPLKASNKVAGYEFLIFFCVMVRRDLFFELGVLDETLETGGGEDVDFCIKAQKAGYQIVEVCPGPKFEGEHAVGGFPIWHKSGKTVKEIENWKDIFEGNMKKVEERYTPALSSSFDMPSIKIAVVMPAYIDTQEKIELFKNAQMAVLAQTHMNLVLCIINDGPDIEKYLMPDTRVRVLTSDHKGAGYARNRALNYIFQMDNFAFVAFCDADDIWTPDHLSSALLYMKPYPHSAVYSIPAFKNIVGNQMFPYGIPIDQSPVLSNIKAKNSIYISTVVMNISAAESVGLFNEELNGIEDWEYWIKYLENGYEFVKDDKTTVTYTITEGSNASAVTEEKIELLKDLHPARDMIRLNLGCGDEYLDGYINCDLYAEKADQKFNADAVPYPDNSVDEIRAYHLIEHFKFQEAFKVLREWNRVLKPGGRLVMETPDLYHTCKKFVELPEHERVRLYGHFFAWPDLSPGQVHYFLFTEGQMMWTLQECGYERMQRLAPDSIYANSNPQWPELYLKTVAFKPMVK